MITKVLESIFEKDFGTKTLKIGDNEPKNAIFCDICKLIQNSAYGIVDITGLNPNVMLEMGMLIALGKPIYVIVKKSDQY